MIVLKPYYSVHNFDNKSLPWLSFFVNVSRAYICSCQQYIRCTPSFKHQHASGTFCELIAGSGECLEKEDCLTGRPLPGGKPE